MTERRFPPRSNLRDARLSEATVAALFAAIDALPAPPPAPARPRPSLRIVKDQRDG